MAVEARVFLDFGVIHVRQRAGSLRALPARRAEVRQLEAEVELIDCQVLLGQQLVGQPDAVREILPCRLATFR